MINIGVRPEEPGITLDRVRFGYGELELFSDLNWELEQGRSVAIMGASGVGKSTFLLIAAGLVAPNHGTVLLGGHPLRRLTPSERVRRGLKVGFVFQGGGLFSNMDTYSNVSLPLFYHKDVLGLDDEAITRRTEEVLELTQIDKRSWTSLPAHLSFGDRKRLSLARALSIEPNYFFFDDPDIGMDQRTAAVTHRVLCQLRDTPEVTLIVTTNRSKLIDRLDIDGYRIESGKLEAARGVSHNPSHWSMPPKIVIT